jgi:hypothetical protein
MASMIRHAEKKDIEAIKKIAFGYYEEKKLQERSGIPIDEESVELIIRLHMTAQRRSVLIEEDESGNIIGLIASVVSPWPTNIKILCCQDTLAWGKIDGLRIFADMWAITVGAVVGAISCLEIVPGERLRRFGKASA